MSKENVVSLRPGIERRGMGEALFIRAGGSGAYASLCAVGWAGAGHFAGSPAFPTLVLMMSLATLGALLVAVLTGVEIVRSPRGRELDRARQVVFLVVPLFTALAVGALVYVLAQRAFFGG